MHLRLAHEHELALLRDIERAAGACFRDIGLIDHPAQYARANHLPALALSTFCYRRRVLNGSRLDCWRPIRRPAGASET